jgi:hypothetical protein
MAITFSKWAERRRQKHYVKPAISSTSVGAGTFSDTPRGRFGMLHAHAR